MQKLLLVTWVSMLLIPTRAFIPQITRRRTSEWSTIPLLMGIDLYAYGGKKKIQLGKRLPAGEERDQREYLGSHQIWKDWRDSDEGTWPRELRFFWWGMKDYNDAQRVIRAIRKYYPEDVDLLSFAEWLEQFDEDVTFEVSE